MAAGRAAHSPVLVYPGPQRQEAGNEPWAPVGPWERPWNRVYRVPPEAVEGSPGCRGRAKTPHNHHKTTAMETVKYGYRRPMEINGLQREVLVDVRIW